MIDQDNVVDHHGGGAEFNLPMEPQQEDHPQENDLLQIQQEDQVVNLLDPQHNLLQIQQEDRVDNLLFGAMDIITPEKQALSALRSFFLIRHCYQNEPRYKSEILKRWDTKEKFETNRKDVEVVIMSTFPHYETYRLRSRGKLSKEEVLISLFENNDAQYVKWIRSYRHERINNLYVKLLHDLYPPVAVAPVQTVPADEVSDNDSGDDDNNNGDASNTVVVQVETAVPTTVLNSNDKDSSGSNNEDPATFKNVYGIPAISFDLFTRGIIASHKDRGMHVTQSVVDNYICHHFNTNNGTQIISSESEQIPKQAYYYILVSNKVARDTIKQGHTTDSLQGMFSRFKTFYGQDICIFLFGFNYNTKALLKRDEGLIQELMSNFETAGAHSELFDRYCKDGNNKLVDLLPGYIEVVHHAITGNVGSACNKHLQYHEDFVKEFTKCGKVTNSSNDVIQMTTASRDDILQYRCCYYRGMMSTKVLQALKHLETNNPGVICVAKDISTICTELTGDLQKIDSPSLNSKRTRPPPSMELLLKVKETPLPISFAVSAESRSAHTPLGLSSAHTASHSSDQRTKLDTFQKRFRENDPYGKDRKENKYSDSWDKETLCGLLENKKQYGRVIRTGERVEREPFTGKHDFDFATSDCDESDTTLYNEMKLIHDNIIGSKWTTRFEQAHIDQVENFKPITEEIVTYGKHQVLQKHAKFDCVYKWGVVDHSLINYVVSQFGLDFVWEEKKLELYKPMLDYNIIIITASQDKHYSDILLVNPTAPNEIMGSKVPFVIYLDSLEGKLSDEILKCLSAFWFSLVHYAGLSDSVGDGLLAQLLLKKNTMAIQHSTRLRCALHTIKTTDMIVSLLKNKQEVFTSFDLFQNGVSSYQTSLSHQEIEFYAKEVVQIWTQKVNDWTQRMSRLKTPSTSSTVQNGYSGNAMSKTGSTVANGRKASSEKNADLASRFGLCNPQTPAAEPDSEFEFAAKTFYGSYEDARQSKEVKKILKSFFWMAADKKGKKNHEEDEDDKEDEANFFDEYCRIKHTKKVTISESEQAILDEKEEELKQKIIKHMEDIKQFNKQCYRMYESIVYPIAETDASITDAFNYTFLKERQFFNENCDNRFMQFMDTKHCISDGSAGPWTELMNFWDLNHPSLIDVRGHRCSYRAIGSKEQIQIRIQLGSIITHCVIVDQHPPSPETQTRVRKDNIITIQKFLVYNYLGAVLMMSALCYLFAQNEQHMLLDCQICRSHTKKPSDTMPSPDMDDYIEYQILRSLGFKEFKHPTKFLRFVIDPNNRNRPVTHNPMEFFCVPTEVSKLSDAAAMQYLIEKQRKNTKDKAEARRDYRQYVTRKKKTKQSDESEEDEDESGEDDEDSESKNDSHSSVDENVSEKALRNLKKRLSQSNTIGPAKKKKKMEKDTVSTAEADYLINEICKLTGESDLVYMYMNIGQLREKFDLISRNKKTSTTTTVTKSGSTATPTVVPATKTTTDAKTTRNKKTSTTTTVTKSGSTATPTVVPATKTTTDAKTTRNKKTSTTTTVTKSGSTATPTVVPATKTTTDTKTTRNKKTSTTTTVTKSGSTATLSATSSVVPATETTTVTVTGEIGNTTTSCLLQSSNSITYDSMKKKRLVSNRIDVVESDGEPKIDVIESDGEPKLGDDFSVTGCLKRNRRTVADSDGEAEF